MTLKRIIDIADKAYPDGLIREYTQAVGTDAYDHIGDTLAEFVVIELQDTYDADATDAEQLDTALSAMRTAICELQDVADAFEGRALCCTR